MKFNLAIALLLLTQTSHAQNVLQSNLSWQTSQASDLRTGSSRQHQSVFKIYATSRIEWEQRNGATITRYTITGATGAWPDVSKPGKVTYSVRHDDKSGTLVLEKTTSETSITVDFSQGNTHGIKQKFIVQLLRQ